MKSLRQEQIDMTGRVEEKEKENSVLRVQVEQLHNKRKSLLEAL